MLRFSTVLILLHLALSFSFGQSYTWTTIVGRPGVSGSLDGTNNQALLRDPMCLCVSQSGCIYVADYGNHTVRMVEPCGTNWVVSTIAGVAGQAGHVDGTNETTRLVNPVGISLDGEGRLYVTQWDHTVRMLSRQNTNWVTTTISGSAGNAGWVDGTNEVARFASPCGIVSDPGGVLYLAEVQNLRIRRIGLVGTNRVVTTIAGTGYAGVRNGLASQATFGMPFGIAMDRMTNLFVTDAYPIPSIRRISPSGSDWWVTTIAGPEVWSSDSAGYRDGWAAMARFYFPRAIAADDAGNLYVGDDLNYTIRKLLPVGTNYIVTTIGGTAYETGTSDGTDGAARFMGPIGLAAGTAGDLYVSDRESASSNSLLRASCPLGPAPVPLVLQADAVGNGKLDLMWRSSSGLTYQLQCATNSAAGEWMDTGPSIAGTNGMVSTPVAIGSAPAAAFRLVLRP